MFVEITEDSFKIFKNSLRENGVRYVASDCTLPSDTIKHVHLEFEDIDRGMVTKLAKELDISYGLVAETSKKTSTEEEDFVL